MDNLLLAMVERIRRPLSPLTLALTIATAGSLAPAVALRDAHASGPTPQLPDVVADPPDNVSLAVSSETPTKEPTEAKLLLRFNGYVHNLGPGALDFRGAREAPAPGEPANPPMGVFQRIYNSDGAYTEEPSAGQMVYVDADGHHHWHLQRVAFYSLWDAGMDAEVAPAQKVGFCLEDSERIETTGPSEPVYSDSESSPFGSREFCREHQPEATEVYEGISEGWRDSYKSNLAFQWVDVSDVLPGEYRLRAEADPEHLIRQTGGEKPPAYAQRPTVVPGFDAQAESSSVEAGHAATIALAARRWAGAEADEQPSAQPSYAIVTPPAHGTLSSVTSGQVTYTPDGVYSGPDSFTFLARDPNSPFPQSPAVASVAIDVGDPPAPSVAIEGAPTSMIAGTSIVLSALVSNDAAAVRWSASWGALLATGPSAALYTAPSAPPAGGHVTVTAESAKGGRDQRTIEIVPVPTPQPKPEAPQQPPPPGPHAQASTIALSAPAAMLIGRKLYMTAVAGRAGRLRITALLHGRRIVSCVARVRARQSFTCTTTLPRDVSTHAPIGVWATLRVGRHLLQTVRPAAPPAPSMRPRAAVALRGVSWRGVKRAWRFLCGM
jgi:Lysyl oxidase/Bacterial Ig domain